MLEHLRREADDLHEVAVAQLAGDGAKDAGPPWVVLRVDDHGGVLVEGDVRAVLAPELLLRTHDDGLDDLAFLDRALRVGLLDRRGDDVADACVAPARAALDADAEDLARAGVVGDLEAGLVLDHRARSRMSTSRQRLVRDIGRHSTTRTRSPSLASLRSSWACTVLEERTILRWRRWRLAASMRTVIVLSALSETTLPRRTCGEPGPWSAGGVPSPFVVFFARSSSRRRRRAVAFCRRSSRRSSGVAARRRPRFARVATRRSCGVIGGGAGSAGAAGAAAAGGSAAAAASGSPLDTSGSVPSAAAAAASSAATGDSS